MYTGIKDPQIWVLPQVLLEQADTNPDLPWVTMSSGEQMTFAQAATDARRVAGCSSMNAKTDIVSSVTVSHLHLHFCR